MRRTCVVLAILLGSPGCANLLSSSSDGGADDGSAVTGGDGGVPATAQGADCAQESTTGATLCTAISVCPNLAVDHDVYPNCGFRIRGMAIDVECVCNGQLCPLGSPTTCDQAAQLLQGQSEATVCTQVDEGRCTGGTPAPAGSAGAPASTCDATCRTECAGDPSCLKMCGC
jgi:hypothetical protein